MALSARDAWNLGAHLTSSMDHQGSGGVVGCLTPRRAGIPATLPPYGETRTPTLPTSIAVSEAHLETNININDIKA